MSATGASQDDWNQHWLDYAAATALNPAQAYRRKLVFERLALRDARSPVRLLDVGSGTGDFALDVVHERPDAEILGLDLSASGVDLAKRKVPQGHFYQRDLTQPVEGIDRARQVEGLGRFQGWATHAVCAEVLEHIDDPAALLRNVLPFLAPGARLVVTVPSGPMSAFDRHIGHRAHFSRARLEATLKAGGLDDIRIDGAGFPFFNLYRLVVVARGKKVIDDVAGGEDSRALPFSARAAMRAFSWLFKLNSSRSTFGWQLAAVAFAPR